MPGLFCPSFFSLERVKAFYFGLALGMQSGFTGFNCLEDSLSTGESLRFGRSVQMLSVCFDPAKIRGSIGRTGFLFLINRYFSMTGKNIRWI
jgi:hypothetical protein